MSSNQELLSAKYLAAEDHQTSQDSSKPSSKPSVDSFAKGLSAVIVLALFLAGGSWMFLHGEEWFDAAKKPVAAPTVKWWGNGRGGYASGSYGMRNNVQFQQQTLEMEWQLRNNQHQVQQSLSSFK